MAEWLKPIKDSWLACIEEAVKHKREQFQDDADEAMKFFDGPYDFLYTIKETAEGAEDPLCKPNFRMTYNKVAEAVQMFGPSLYHRNPYRQVNPAKMPPMPMMDQNDPQAQMMMQQMQQQLLQQGSRVETLSKQLEYVINYTPNELDLRGHSRQVVDEALIKGMGVWWTGPFRPPGSPITLVGSFYDSVDHLVIDPDMESIENAKWIARKRVFPVWEVEQRFGLPPGKLRGNMESRNMQSQYAVDSDYPDEKRRGNTNDLFTYWEVYSRMGMGHDMKLKPNNQTEAMKPTLDKFGKHIFLAVSDDYDCPLNLPDDAIEGEYGEAPLSFDEAFARVQWPTPTWAEHTNPWPFTYVAFHKRPRKVWPMSHMKPAMGEIKFLNWAFSFVADKIKNTSRDFIAIQKSVGEALKNAILHGRDLELLEIESQHGRKIDEIVSFLQHPQFNGDIWKVIDAVMTLLDQRLGLNELMYGNSSKQLRSASEAQIKGDNIRVRPDDMAECVEDAHTKLARKEAIASRWHLTVQDVMPILGPVLAPIWEQVVMSSDPYSIVLELDYRIEAGSIRKPNKNRDQENINAALQQWMPIIVPYFQGTGDVSQLNKLAEIWCKAFDHEVFQFQPPPPPQPDPKIQADMQMAQMEMQMKQGEFQMKAQSEQQKLQLEMAKGQQQMQIEQEKLALEQRKAELEIQLEQVKAQMEMQIEREKASQEMQLSQAEFGQEMRQDEQQHAQEMQQAQQSHLLDAIATDQQHQQGLQQSKAVGEQKVKQAKAEAKAKPKTPPKSK